MDEKKSKEKMNKEFRTTRQKLAERILNEGIDETVLSLSPQENFIIIKELAGRLDLLINLDNDCNNDERDVFDYNDDLNLIVAETIYPDILEKGGHCDE